MHGNISKWGPSTDRRIWCWKEYDNHNYFLVGVPVWTVNVLHYQGNFSDNADTYDTCNNNHKLSSKYRLVIILPLYSSPFRIISVKTINTKLITDNFIVRPIDLTIPHTRNTPPFTLYIIANGRLVNIRCHAPYLSV